MITTNDMKTTNTVPNTQGGVALLITLLLVGVLIGISTSLLNITLKQYQLAGIALASEVAFQAANAGMECVLYHDFPASGVGSIFDVPDGAGNEQTTQPQITCGNGITINSVDSDNLPYDDPTTPNGLAVSGGEQNFTFDLVSSPNNVCVDVSIYKYYSTTVNLARTIDGVVVGSTSCVPNSVCTIIQSRGYNVPCAEIKTAPRVVEREYTQVY